MGDAARVRAYLGAFLFSGDDVEKKVGVLSGGEKARLALARLLMEPAGLLLLDEPTNHLDMASREVLTEALRQFEGSIVFISHDRRLINAIATEVLEVVAGRPSRYPGDWEYYQWKRGHEISPSLEPGCEGLSPVLPTKSRGGATPARGRSSYQERKELERRYRRVEKRIFELEERQKQLAGLMSSPSHGSDYQLLLDAHEESSRVADELQSLYAEWEGLANRVLAQDK